MTRLAGKIALITGAAKGLGEADARLFAAEGATVILADVDDATGAALAAEIDGQAQYRRLDVRDEAAWATLLDAIVAEHGRLDILVNNAGVVELGTPESVTEKDYRFIMAVSVDGVVFGTKHAIRVMRANGGRGAIVNMASIAAIQGEANVAAYCAAKGAIDAYTRATAVHCAQSGYAIRANSVLPGGINTPMVQSLPEKFARAIDDGALQQRAAAANRLGDPIDVAQLVLFLASDESRFINGQSHVIDDAASVTTGDTQPR